MFLSYTLLSMHSGCNHTLLRLVRRGHESFISARGLHTQRRQFDFLPSILCIRHQRSFHPITASASYSSLKEISAGGIYYSSTTGDGNGSAPQSNPTTRVLLPTLGQNGTLVLRSDSKSRIARVQIISQWRDDSLIELLPISSMQDGDDNATAVERATFNDGDSVPSSSRYFGRLQLKHSEDGTTTSLGRRGAMVEVNVLNENPSKGVDHAHENEPMNIVATVPEKFNITCQIANGDIVVVGKLEGDAHLSTSKGDITVSKLRGHNVTLDTTGDYEDEDAIADANASSSNDSSTLPMGVIHVRKAIEARTVQINTPSRLRAQMLNGSDVSVRAGPSETHSTKFPTTQDDCGPARGSFNKLDDDDEGAIIDIGSLYVSNGSGGVEGEPENEARLFVDNTGKCNPDRNNNNSPPGLVRIKSTHGHVTVHAKSNRNASSCPPSEKVELPCIDLGGVNGSCDVTLETSPSGYIDPTTLSDPERKITAARVHFDSMTPESISTITARGGVGRTSITMDRKVEADVRLLSVSNATAGLPSHIDAHSLTSDEIGDVRSALRDVDDSARTHGGRSNGTKNNTTVDRIQRSVLIETNAYTGEWGWGALDSACSNEYQKLSHSVEYAQGTMRNRSEEPDSRFDMRSRGGKINIDGAASQALHGFGVKQSKGGSVPSSLGPSDSAPSLPHMPLLALASDGEIKLETLSWFGSIARRYGLEEAEKEQTDSRSVGRQASRSPRLDN